MLLLALLVGCSDENFAGSGVVDAQADAGTAGATGTGGAGAGGATGTAGQGGAEPLSCAIQLEQINGTDPAAVYDVCNNPQQVVQAIVANGMTDFFGGGWAFNNSFSVTPRAGVEGQCNVDIRYKRPASNGCTQGELLFVHLVVPAI